MIYLASKSPRRTELLSQIGVEHQTIDIEVDEAINPKKSAKENVTSLSALKCQEGVRHILDQKKVIFPVFWSTLKKHKMFLLLLKGARC